MNIVTKWDGISAKFYQVHKHLIDGWLRAYLAVGSAAPYYHIIPTEPLGAVTLDGLAAAEVVTAATLRIDETMRYGRGGVVARILTIGPDDRSLAVIDEWERKHRGESAEDILWFPSFDKIEKVAWATLSTSKRPNRSSSSNPGARR